MQFSEGVSGTTIVIASNYFNHHQRYLSEALDDVAAKPSSWVYLNSSLAERSVRYIKS